MAFINGTRKWREPIGLFYLPFFSLSNTSLYIILSSVWFHPCSVSQFPFSVRFGAGARNVGPAPPYIRCPAKNRPRNGDLAGEAKTGPRKPRKRGTGRGEKKKIPCPAPQCGVVRGFFAGPRVPRSEHYFHYDFSVSHCLLHSGISGLPKPT